MGGSRGLGAGAGVRRLACAGVRRCSAVRCPVSGFERQHQLNALTDRSLALHSPGPRLQAAAPSPRPRALAGRHAPGPAYPRRVARLSPSLIATMGRSDFSTGTRALAFRLSRTASEEPSSPDPLRSPSVTLRSLPTMPTAPTVQTPVLGFGSRQPPRPSARPSPVRLRFGLVFASGPSPSASRPAAAFGYRGVLDRTSAPRRTLTSSIGPLRGALPASHQTRRAV